MSAQTHFNGLQESCVTRITSVKILIRSTLKTVQKTFVRANITAKDKMSEERRSDNSLSTASYNLALPCYPRPSLLLVVLVLSPQHRVVAATESVSDSSLSPGQNMTEGQAMSRGHYKCAELSNKDHRENRTGERLKSL